MERPELGGAPRPGHEVEVERRVHLVGAQVVGEALGVRKPDLPDQHAGALVAVGDAPPGAVDVVQLVAVLGGVLARARVLGHLRQRRVLDEQSGRVDAHAGDAAVEPEPQDVLVLGDDVGVVPVEVGLLGGEQVQVPLAGGAVGVGRARPGVAREVRHPVVGHLVAVVAETGVEPEPLALGRARAGGERGLEPGVLVADVVGDDVDDGADAEGERLLMSSSASCERPERGVDGAVVADVVAAVGERGRVPRGEPDRVDAEVAR